MTHKHNSEQAAQTEASDMLPLVRKGMSHGLTGWKKKTQKKQKTTLLG